MKTGIWLNFDGNIIGSWERILSGDFSDIPNITIGAFTGKNKRHCPEILYVADTLANELGREPYFDVVGDKRYVNIPISDLAERRKLFVK